jgi:hypothetical protein
MIMLLTASNETTRTVAKRKFKDFSILKVIPPLVLLI